MYSTPVVSDQYLRSITVIGHCGTLVSTIEYNLDFGLAAVDMKTISVGSKQYSL